MINSGWIATPYVELPPLQFIEVTYPGGLGFKIYESNDFCEKLRDLDLAGNSDSQLTVADFDGDEAKMLNATCDVFFPRAPDAPMMQKEKGFRDFVGLYGRVKRFAEFTADLKEKNIFGFDYSDIELGEEDWPKVKKQMTGTGPFTPEKITQLARDIYLAYRRLSGMYDQTPRINNEPQVELCDTDFPGVFGFVYNSSSIPPYLGESVEKVAEMYLRGADFLRTYNEVECDEWGWDSCEDAEINIGHIEYLKSIKAGGSWKDEIQVKYCRSQ